MTYKELKRMQEDISKLNTEIFTLRSEVENTIQKLSQVPLGSGVKDKVGELTTIITYKENLKEMLIADFKDAMSRIPNTLEGNCIKLRVQKGFCWAKITTIAGGCNNVDSMKKKCYRYVW